MLRIIVFLRRLGTIQFRLTFPQCIIYLATLVSHRSLRLPFHLLLVPLITVSWLLVSESSIQWASVYPLTRPI